MKRLQFILVTAFVVISMSFSANAGSHNKMSSPNGRFALKSSNKGISLSLLDKGKATQLAVVECPAPKLLGKSLGNKVHYEMLMGKRLNCSNEYNEYVFKLSDKDGSDTLRVRLYNDGAAWASPAKAYPVDMSSARHNWLQKWVDCYEEFFPRDRATAPNQRWGYPALFEYDGDGFALLTESGVDADCAGASMYSTDSPGVFNIVTDGDGRPCWTTLIAGSLADVVESTLVTDNSIPCRLTDTSWIEPGVASWVYWAYNHGSKDYDIVKKYIDMAADMHLPYVLIDAEWDEMQGEHTVVDALNYAHRRGVKPMIWYNSSVGWVDGAPGPKFRLNKPADREREFAWCEENGVAGVKIDFFSGDNNMNLSYMIDLLEDAAKHHMVVNFHGATIPRGWQRTYPNLVSTEGVYGAEWYNNVPTFTAVAAAHNATLPFTRNVVGPMDYTPCAFSDSQHPHITSDAHELALTVLYESGIQHLADKPESYAAQPAQVRDFLSKLPAAWNDTRLIDGYPGKYVVMARRSGDKWYVAAINGTDSVLTVPVDMRRLTPMSTKKATIFTDGENGWDISSAQNFPAEMTMKPRGGFVFVVEPAL